MCPSVMTLVGGDLLTPVVSGSADPRRFIGERGERDSAEGSIWAVVVVARTGSGRSGGNRLVEVVVA